MSGWIVGSDHQPVVYLPLALLHAGARIVIRADGPSEPTARLLERDLATIDPSAVDELHTMDEAVAFSIWPLRAAYWFAVLVGAVALLFTLTGVYGVLAFVVALRTREIGIRSALGASRRSVIALIVGESLKLAGIGIGTGVVLAAALSVVVASRIEAIETFEPLAYVGGAAAVLLACVLGAVVPSRRATQVEPLDALRAQ